MKKSASARSANAGIEIVQENDADTPIDIISDGGELPLEMALPTWLMFAVSGTAYRLAGFLRLFKDTDLEDRQLSRAVLAALLGFKKPASVDDYIKELEASGWLSVERRKTSTGQNLNNLYRIRYTTPSWQKTPTTAGEVSKWIDEIADSASSTKTAAQGVVPKNGLGSPQKRTTPNRSTKTAAQGVVPKNGLGSPQKRTLIRNLRTDLSKESIDRSIDENSATDQKPDEVAALPTDQGLEVVLGLRWGKHPLPGRDDLNQLGLLVDAAFAKNLSGLELRSHLSRALDRCTTSPFPFLVRALTDFLPTPKKVSKPRSESSPERDSTPLSTSPDTFRKELEKINPELHAKLDIQRLRPKPPRKRRKAL